MWKSENFSHGKSSWIHKISLLFYFINLLHEAFIINVSSRFICLPFRRRISRGKCHKSVIRRSEICVTHVLFLWLTFLILIISFVSWYKFNFILAVLPLNDLNIISNYGEHRLLQFSSSSGWVKLTQKMHSLFDFICLRSSRGAEISVGKLSA